ncbi:hydrolase 2, exosortase A system-associated [Piscinibacter sp. XHJ-5]|uniref:hydrolase 2, exosortase A system-associated n=1 Tax=Piscinibacter sp. XHJ-5 TaxID=3037797 RepID=UPI00245342AE|nr:hydrolase 2, exosortase A system-associated [Piscinibacter sp. XHJ-5]
MSASRPVAQQAAFVRGAVGTRWRLVSEPADGDCVGTVVAVHGFAEEMNKSRHMAARMARLLAADGWRVVQKDLLGCGDSSGDFADATWPAWVADVEEELVQADSGRPVWLWGTRAGALLAAAVLPRRPQAHLLLWQPVLSGAQHLQQFLRLHAGARIVGSGKSPASSLSPAQQLRAGTPVEIAGYELTPALTGGLEAATFDVPADFSGRIAWFELGDEAGELSPAAARGAERLRARGVAVETETLAGPPFWQTQEIEVCEALLLRSQAAVDAAALATTLPLAALAESPP